MYDDAIVQLISTRKRPLPNFSFDIRIKIPRPETSVAPERSTSISGGGKQRQIFCRWEEHHSVTTSPELSEHSMASTGIETSTTNEGPDESETAEEKALREESSESVERMIALVSQISTGGRDRQRARVQIVGLVV